MSDELGAEMEVGKDNRTVTFVLKRMISGSWVVNAFAHAGSSVSLDWHEVYLPATTG